MAVEALKIKDKIQKYLVGRIADIGCGDECITENAYGIDGRDFPCVSLLTDSLYGLADKLPPMLSKFETVFSSHVAEHLPDMYKTVNEWGSIVEQGGHLILYLPCGSRYDNFENKEHCHDTRYEQFMLWFKRVFCGEALNFKGEQLLPPVFELIEDGTDYGENRYSFFLVAKKL